VDSVEREVRPEVATIVAPETEDPADVMTPDIALADFCKTTLLVAAPNELDKETPTTSVVYPVLEKVKM
jgi:hypothetical protein